MKHYSGASFKPNDKVRLYDPNPRLNGTITGTVIGGGWTEKSGLCYLVELDKRFKGYLSYPTSDVSEMYISTIVVSASGVMPL